MVVLDQTGDFAGCRRSAPDRSSACPRGAGLAWVAQGGKGGQHVLTIRRHQTAARRKPKAECSPPTYIKAADCDIAAHDIWLPLQT